MRTAAISVLVSVVVFTLPGTVAAQQYRSPMQNHVVCPPGQLSQNGVCVDRGRGGPRHHRDGPPGAGDGWPPELPDYFYGTCKGIANWSMVNCGGTNTGPYPDVRRPPGH